MRALDPPAALPVPLAPVVGLDVPLLPPVLPLPVLPDPVFPVELGDPDVVSVPEEEAEPVEPDPELAEDEVGSVDVVPVVSVGVVPAVSVLALPAGPPASAAEELGVVSSGIVRGTASETCVPPQAASAAPLNSAPSRAAGRAERSRIC